MKLVWWPLGLILAASAIAGCGGGSKPAPTAPDPASPTATPVITATATATGAASPSPAASPTADMQSGEAVTAAAATELGALPRYPLTRENCLRENPDEKICINLATSETIETGIARFAAGDPQGGGFAFLMGRDAAGEWHYWMGSQQQFYVLTELPGELRACGGGAPVTIRQSADPGSTAAGELADGATATAEAFVLTSPGAFGVGGDRGDGWYRVSAPADGWVQASDTTAASLGDCALRDAIEGPTPRG